MMRWVACTQGMIYRFADDKVDERASEPRCAGHPVKVGPLALDLPLHGKPFADARRAALAIAQTGFGTPLIEKAGRAVFGRDPAAER